MVVEFEALVNGEKKLLKLRNSQYDGVLEILTNEGTIGCILVNNLVSIINIETIRCNQKHQAQPKSGTPIDFSRFKRKPKSVTTKLKLLKVGTDE